MNVHEMNFHVRVTIKYVVANRAFGVPPMYTPVLDKWSFVIKTFAANIANKPFATVILGRDVWRQTLFPIKICRQQQKQQKLVPRIIFTRMGIGCALPRGRVKGAVHDLPFHYWVKWGICWSKLKYLCRRWNPVFITERYVEKFLTMFVKHGSTQSASIRLGGDLNSRVS